MSATKANSFYAGLKDSSSTELSMIQPYISLSYKKRTDSGNNWIEVATNRSNFFDTYGIFISKFLVSKTDYTLKFIEATIEITLDSKYMSENAFLMISNPEYIFKITFGIVKQGIAQTEDYIVSQMFSNVRMNQSFITIESTFTSNVSAYLDYNNTVNLGADLQKLLAVYGTNDGYYNLQYILLSITDILQSVYKFKFTYTTLTDPISITLNNKEIFRIGSTESIPILKTKFDSLLAQGKSFSFILGQILTCSPILGDRLLFEWIDEKTINVSLENHNVYDEKDGIWYLNPMTERHLIKNVSLVNEPDYSTFGNDAYINSLTKEYLKSNGMEFYSENIASELRQAMRLKPSEVLSEKSAVIAGLLEKYPGSTADQLQYIAKNIKLRPSIEWRISYGAVSIGFHYPILGLAIADTIQLSGVIQAYAFDKANTSKKNAQYSGLYYITSVLYTYESSTISTEIKASLVEFV